MNNKYLKSRFLIFSSLGKISKTSNLEEREVALRKEYEEFSTYKESEEFDHFIKLEDFVNSDEFQEIKKNINSQKYKDTSDYIKELEYNRLKKSKSIRTYYQVKDSKLLQDYKVFKESDTLAKFQQFDSFFSSDNFVDFKKTLINEKKEKTLEYKNEIKKYQNLKKKYNWFFKFSESKQFDEFKKFEQSEKLSYYIELEDYINKLDLRRLKEEIQNKKQEKIDELNNINSKLKELRKQAKKTKKGEEFSNKDELLELNKLIKSGILKKEIKKRNFENTSEYEKIEEFKKLKKSSEIKKYYKFKNSEKFKNYLELNESQEISEYLELDYFINSKEFDEKIKSIKEINFENTEEYKQLIEYKELKKSSEIKQYFKFINSIKFKIYSNLEGSDEISKFEEVEKYINSEKFIEQKKYMLTKNKFILSEEYKQLVEYNDLNKSGKIKWYHKLVKSNKFDELLKWKETFSDEFNSKTLDSEKWLTSYFWGETLLNDSYVQANDKHFYTKGKNISIDDSVLSISTREESAEGKMWHPLHGFVPKKFDYTTGIINTGQSFRQKYGLFKAKVRVSHNYPVFHAFWLLGDKKVPEIDVFKYHAKSKSKIQVGNYWGNSFNEKEIDKKISNIKGKNFSDDYYIYSIEWWPERIVWRINDVVVSEQCNGVPQEAMYIVFSSGINKNLNNGTLPAKMDIDWVRVYQKE